MKRVVGIAALIFAATWLLGNSPWEGGNVLGPFDNASDAVAAFRRASPGDHIVIRDGTYNGFDGDFGSGRGTAERRIVIRAQTPGGVSLTGRSRIHLNDSAYVTIAGFVFRDGFWGTGTSGAGILVGGTGSRHVRITENLMDSWHSPILTDDCRWVRVFGQHHEIDNNTFINKRSVGVTVEVVRPGPEENFVRIHRNYFGFSFPVLNASGSEMNGLETIRIGTSEQSQSDSSSVVEYNFFEECNGEIEAISNKSGNNVFRGNVFLNNNATLSLRHGRGCTVEDNVFINNVGKPLAGGVRVMDRDHVIRNNYFEGMNQNRRSAISLEYAVVNSPLNRYWPVIGTVINNNTFINSRSAIHSGPPGSADQTIAPVGTQAAGNLIVSAGNETQIRYGQGVPAVNFTNSVAWGAAGNLRLTEADGTPSGIEIADPGVSRNRDALFMPTAQFRAFGMQLPAGARVLQKEDTGASFARGGNRD